MSLERITTSLMSCFGVFTLSAGLIFVGCSQEREVLDVETPVGDVEVNENEATGETSVKIDGEKEE